MSQCVGHPQGPTTRGVIPTGYKPSVIAICRGDGTSLSDTGTYLWRNLRGMDVGHSAGIVSHSDQSERQRLAPTIYAASSNSNRHPSVPPRPPAPAPRGHRDIEQSTALNLGPPAELRHTS